MSASGHEAHRNRGCLDRRSGGQGIQEHTIVRRVTDRQQGTIGAQVQRVDRRDLEIYKIPRSHRHREDGKQRRQQKAKFTGGACFHGRR